MPGDQRNHACEDRNKVRSMTRLPILQRAFSQPAIRSGQGLSPSVLISRTPEVQQCYHVPGEADFVVVITVATMKDYEALTRRLFFNSHNVRRFRTLAVMDRVKVGLQVPIMS
jgi:DNA-binding Lrp family transcriptional regulator